MKSDLGSKLIIVSDINVLKLFEAKGVKIVRQLESRKIHSETDHNERKHDGYNKKKSTQSVFYDPHTQTKDIEYQESSKAASELIEKQLSYNSDYKEVIIVADAKMLGALRNNLTDNTSKLVSKEVDKDMIKHNTKDIEKVVFGS